MKIKFPGSNPQIDWALGLIVTGIAIGWLWVILYATQASAVWQFLTISGVAFTISGAALVSGGMLGFLFGIPRTLQIERGAQQQNAEDGEGHNQEQARVASIQANTNLEQISDWLTKILVGVGLTQISKLPAALQSYASFVSPGLGKFPNSEVFAVGVLVFFLTCGFLLGFLWTRFYLTGALRQEEQKALAALKEEVDQIKQQTAIDARALNILQRVLNPPGDDKPPTQDEINKAIAEASSSVKAQIYYQAQTQRSENWRNVQDKPKMERTIPIFRALIASDKENVYHANHGQLGFALKDQRTPEWAEAEAELTKAIELRGSWDQHGWLFYEFNRAICRIKQDPAFNQNKPSDEGTKDKIMTDLITAGNAFELEELVAKDEITTKWLAINKIKWPPAKR